MSLPGQLRRKHKAITDCGRPLHSVVGSGERAALALRFASRTKKKKKKKQKNKHI